MVRLSHFPVCPRVIKLIRYAIYKPSIFWAITPCVWMFMLGIRWSGLRVDRFRLPGFANELVEHEALQGLQPSDEVLGGDELAAVLAP